MQLAPPKTRTYLYRYFDKIEYAEAMVQAGAIRIGSLRKYSQMEEVDGDVVRGDALEGHSKIEIDYHQGPTTHLSEKISRNFHLTNNSVIIGGSITDNTPQSLMLCVSERLQYRIAREFNAVACVQIVNPDRVHAALKSTMHELGYAVTPWQKVVYVQSRTMNFRHEHANLPGWLQKEHDRYYRQREWRMMYFATQGQTVPEHLDIVCPDIAPYCKLHKLF